MKRKGKKKGKHNLIEMPPPDVEKIALAAGIAPNEAWAFVTLRGVISAAFHDDVPGALKFLHLFTRSYILTNTHKGRERYALQEFGVGILAEGPDIDLAAKTKK